MDNPGIRYYEFGEFRLDTKRRILIRDGNRIPLTGKNFDLLFVMIQSGGRILEHDELLDRVWEGMFVEQANLKKSVSNLRNILGESPHESLYIKTIPRRGYSFVADVRALPDELETAVYREIETEIEIEEIIETDSPAEDFKALPAAASKKFASKSKPFQFVVAAAALILISGAVFFAVRSFRERPSLNYSIENVRAKRLTSEGNLGNSAPISPDGNYLVYPVYQGGEGSLWLKQLQTGSLAQLTPPLKVQYWAYNYSPDGIYVYYIVNHLDDPSQSGLYRIPTLGGAPQKLTADRPGGGLTFAPDGSRFAYTRQGESGKIELVTAKTDGSDLRTAFVVPENKFLWSVKWSPDNANLLCAFRERAENKSVGYVAEIPWENNPENPTESLIIPRQEQVFINAAWLPDKTAMLLSIREQNADICQIWQYFPASGEKRRVTNDDNSYRFINLTQDGKSLVTVQESFQSEIWVADRRTLDFQPLPNIKNAGSVAWTKDGNLIYEALEDSRNTISMAGADGAFRQRITNGNDGIYLNADLSQDGNFITFLSNRGGSSQIWRIGLDGKNAQQLTSGEIVGLRSHLLSDGHTLLFMMSALGKGWILYKQTDGKIVPVTSTDTGLWSVSPDEKLLAVEVRDEKTKKFTVRIQNLETGELLNGFEINAIRQLSWTRDGRALAYISPTREADELVLRPIDGSPPKVLSNARGQRLAGFSWSHDGSKLAIVRSKFMTDAFMIKAQEN
jgi:DNA-binding winged helix-turn-helix (wHTH) protein/Tol biopolymer transport system component